jgi:hypothetical protein
MTLILFVLYNWIILSAHHKFHWISYNKQLVFILFLFTISYILLEENRFLGCISETNILPCFSFRWHIVPCKYAVYVDCMPFACRLMMLKALQKGSKFCKISSNLLPFSSTSDVLIENQKSPSSIPPVIFSLEGLWSCSIFSSIVGNYEMNNRNLTRNLTIKDDGRRFQKHFYFIFRYLHCVLC